ncbi:MAG TPA: hypothetical protein DHM44_07740, partial [Flexistipes sinusarabici]|nr:hypothetical protein [Flexistipes sinusarabici]
KKWEGAKINLYFKSKFIVLSSSLEGYNTVMKLKKLLYSLFIFLTLTAGYSTAFAAHDNILIINSYFTNYAWTEQQMNGFFSKLKESNMFAGFEYHIENLDTKKIPFNAEYR